MNKFWIWLFKKARNEIKENHLKEKGADLKCPQCNEWLSVSGVDYKHQMFDEEFGAMVICGKCNGQSYWNMVAAPVALHCNSQGTPIT